MKIRVAILALTLMFGQNVFADDPVVVVVDPENLNGWFSLNQAGSASVTIGTTQGYGIGTGSLEYLGMDSSDDRAEAGRIMVGSLSGISGIGYFFYSDSVQAAALKIEYWSPTHFGTLNWEPANNGSPSTGQWNSSGNASGGNWWTTESLNGGTEGGQTDQRTLADWVTELGDPGTTLLRIGAGSGWSSAVTTYADLVWVDRTNEYVQWDFETQAPAPLPPRPPQAKSSPIPTAGTWALIIMTLGLAFFGFRRIRKTA